MNNIYRTMTRKGDYKFGLTDELIAAVLDGNGTPQETMLLINTAKFDARIRELLNISAKVDRDLGMAERQAKMTIGTDERGTQLRLVASRQSTSIYPVMAMAARSESNLCDIDCERHILRRLGLSVSVNDLAKESKRNYWLREQGTPLFNIGRLLEQQGLVVRRQFEGTLDLIRRTLINHGSVIAIVNGELLLSGKRNAENPISPDHAITVVDYDPEMESVVVYDPQSQQMMDCVSADRFLDAWQDSERYMAVAYRYSKQTYDPQPVDVSDVVLDDNLHELGEFLAENNHEIWARHRVNEGWTYGPEREDSLKQTPDLVPYHQLPENEKRYDRETALQTLKLVQKFGYEIVKKKMD